jgi:LPXTG-motif cell wall-anchored protein
MKKIKKILLVAVAATMLASTTVFAAETATTATEATANAGKTYGDQFKELLGSYGVLAQIQNDAVSILDEFEITDAQAASVMNSVQQALGILGGETDTAKIKKIVKDNLEEFQVILGDVQDAIPGLKVIADVNNFSVKITKRVNGVSTELCLWEKDVLKEVGTNQAFLAALNDQDTLTKFASAATAVSQNGSTTTDPSTVTPGDVDDDPTVDPDGDYTEEEKAFLEKWNAKAEEYEAVKATYNADKTLTNALAVRDKLREFEELLDTCPESLKAELQAKYDACAAEVDAILAAFGSNERVDANKSGTSTFAPSNKGTLAKTATNNGNMAVAGLAMIAVAGTVFVVSKKKIAE